ncbi:exo-alpha-sialidase [Pedobacter sp. KR3-3]|uniref:exo-alpha-sialidase n=1 Tax=Pedobacter albus TaxID=3113905 RepID=A0ABU7I579_9SPHI|nr:exo-alpha-sialidase [Pedobacter sp. KR3-3]MEE1944554.1 exo-alpha-sialidase [Pedobacter sp. KR3-3]
MKNTFLLLIALGFFGPVPVNAQEIKVSLLAKKQPVFTQSNQNPVLRLSVNNTSSLSLNAFSGTVGAESVKDIEKIELYDSDTLSHFTTKHLLGEAQIDGRKFTIKFKEPATFNQHHLWLNVVLKNSAKLSHQLLLQADYFLAGNGKQIRLDREQFAFRIGRVVRKHGDDNVDTYRIPGIATTVSGALISVYDIRYLNARDLPANIDVGMSRSLDRGETWEPMKVIMDMGEPNENNGVGDPAILYDAKTHTIWMAALWSKGNRSISGSKPGLLPDETGQLVLVKSTDDGLTWSKPISITAEVKNPKWNLFFNGPGTGTVMADGTLVFPAQYWDENKLPHSTIIYSKDQGQSWKAGIGAKNNTTESAVVETVPGQLMLNMRDNAGKFRSIATTNDFGQTWQTHPTSANTLVDPVCMGSLIRAKAKVKGKLQEVLFFSNPNSSVSRKNLTLKASLDLGQTWSEKAQLLIDERESYGYSALTMIDENTIGILYEGVRDLYFVQVKVNDLFR